MVGSVEGEVVRVGNGADPVVKHEPENETREMSVIPRETENRDMTCLLGFQGLPGFYIVGSQAPFSVYFRRMEAKNKNRERKEEHALRVTVA